MLTGKSLADTRPGVQASNQPRAWRPAQFFSPTSVGSRTGCCLGMLYFSATHIGLEPTVAFRNHKSTDKEFLPNFQVSSSPSMMLPVEGCIVASRSDADPRHPVVANSVLTCSQRPTFSLGLSPPISVPGYIRSSVRPLSSEPGWATRVQVDTPSHWLPCTTSLQYQTHRARGSQHRLLACNIWPHVGFHPKVGLILPLDRPVSEPPECTHVRLDSCLLGRRPAPWEPSPNAKTAPGCLGSAVF